MASSSKAKLACLALLFLFLAVSDAQRPKALVVAVAKDAATRQYVAQLRQRTPLVPVPAVVDLGGSFLWVDCDRGFVSSTSSPVRCNSAQCAAARSGACINDTICGFLPNNPFIRTSSIGELAEDVLVVASTDGSNPGPLATAARTLYGCGSTGLLEGLASGAKGIAGLGRNPVALPSQLAAKFSLRRRFAVCLSNTVGVAFFGGGPYRLLPGIDVSSSLLYTPLLVNPVPTTGASFSGQPPPEYFIGVTAIQVNGKRVAGFNAGLLTINKRTGRGGTRISTAEPYTVLEGSIFRAVAAAFARESGLRSVPPVKPFGFCFDSSKVGSTRVGPGVPQIDLVLQSAQVFWRVFGANSVVEVRAGVSCLAFVDGGPDVTSAIVIGGYQLEDNLLEFDLATSRLGFSSSLRFRQTTCANFNFTSTSP